MATGREARDPTHTAAPTPARHTARSSPHPPDGQDDVVEGPPPGTSPPHAGWSALTVGGPGRLTQPAPVPPGQSAPSCTYPQLSTSIAPGHSPRPQGPGDRVGLTWCVVVVDRVLLVVVVGWSGVPPGWWCRWWCCRVLVDCCNALLPWFPLGLARPGCGLVCGRGGSVVGVGAAGFVLVVVVRPCRVPVWACSVEVSW